MQALVIQKNFTTNKSKLSFFDDDIINFHKRLSVSTSTHIYEWGAVDPTLSLAFKQHGHSLSGENYKFCLHTAQILYLLLSPFLRRRSGQSAPESSLSLKKTDLENVMSVARAARVKFQKWGKTLVLNIHCFVENVSQVFAVFSKIGVVKQELIVKKWVKRVRKGYFWILKRNDANKNGIICIICCCVTIFIWCNLRASG